MGGSLVSKGGQNPLEAIRFGCIVVHGKHTFNFNEVYSKLDKENLSFNANNFKQLNKVIFNLLIKKYDNKKKVIKFKKIGSNILLKNVQTIKSLI